MSKRVTRNDVAKLAGVSTAVVSYVMNNGPRGVAPDTRARVLAAVEKLGYRSSHVARSLRMQQTHTLGIIVFDSSNIYFGEVIKAIEDEAYKREYSILVGNTNNNLERVQSYIDTFISRQVDGIIFLNTKVSETELDLIQQFRIQSMSINSEGEVIPSIKKAMHSVSISTERGGYEVGVHLLERGHRNLACIVGKDQHFPASEIKWYRLEGFRQALGEKGLEPLVIKEGEAFEDGYKAAQKLLQRENPPSAIFACNDLVAIGVLRAAADLDLHIPDDLAVCGFDDIELARFIKPSLTTVHIPKRAIGEKAAQIIIDQIKGQHGSSLENEEHSQTEILKFETTLVVREST
jgi:LacI family transcriptional regulator